MNTAELEQLTRLREDDPNLHVHQYARRILHDAARHSRRPRDLDRAAVLYTRHFLEHLSTRTLDDGALRRALHACGVYDLLDDVTRALDRPAAKETP